MKLSACSYPAFHLLFALLMIAPAMPAAHAEPGPLDGKVFVADAGEIGKPADEKDDVITFANGTFHSSICDQWGYGKGTYRATLSGDEISFEVETVSEKDGRLQWKGRIKGEVIQGSFTHFRKPGFFRPNPDPIEHWFKGRART